MTWIFLLKQKSDVCVSIGYFLKFITTQFEKTVKIIIIDNGTEFINHNCEKLFVSLGIIHPRTCAYTPRQNGVAERKQRHILEVTRAIRFHGKIPIKFWGHCALFVVYLINRFPSTVIGNVSPFERLYGKKPNLNHLRVLDCLCFAKIIQEYDKLMTRAKLVVHMGYLEVQKGYILFFSLSKVKNRTANYLQKPPVIFK